MLFKAAAISMKQKCKIMKILKMFKGNMLQSMQIGSGRHDKGSVQNKILEQTNTK